MKLSLSPKWCEQTFTVSELETTRNTYADGVPPSDMDSALILAAGVVLFVFGAGAVYKGLKELSPAYHILRDEPRSIQDLVYHSGPAEIEGVARGDEKGVKAPFSGTVCLAYEYEVKELQSSGKSSHWETLDEGYAAAPFLVEDETGSVQVDGRVAELHLEAHSLRLEPGEEPPPRVAKYIRENESVDMQDGSLDLVVTELNFGNDQQFIERRLDIDEFVHVYGHVERTNAREWGSGIVDALLTRSERTPLIVSDTTERGAAWRIIKSRLLWPVGGLVLLGVSLYVLAAGLVPLVS